VQVVGHSHGALRARELRALGKRHRGLVVLRRPSVARAWPGACGLACLPCVPVSGLRLALRSCRSPVRPLLVGFLTCCLSALSVAGWSGLLRSFVMSFFRCLSWPASFGLGGTLRGEVRLSPPACLLAGLASCLSPLRSPFAFSVPSLAWPPGSSCISLHLVIHPFCPLFLPSLPCPFFPPSSSSFRRLSPCGCGGWLVLLFFCRRRLILHPAGRRT